eukprot:7378415-Prymnesium_polylepis.1
MRNQRRILRRGDTGRSVAPRLSSGTSLRDWERAMGNAARNPGREWVQCRRVYFLVLPQYRSMAFSSQWNLCRKRQRWRCTCKQKQT